MSCSPIRPPPNSSPASSVRSPPTSAPGSAPTARHLAWLGSVFGTRVVPVGVDGFGQSGSVEELYGVFDLLPEQLVNAALVAVA